MKKIGGQKCVNYSKLFAYAAMKNLRKNFLNDYHRPAPTALERLKSRMKKWALKRTLKFPVWIFKISFRLLKRGQKTS